MRAEQLVAIINNRGVTDSAAAPHRGPADLCQSFLAVEVEQGEYGEARQTKRSHWRRVSKGCANRHQRGVRLEAGYCGDRGVEQVEKPPSVALAVPAEDSPARCKSEGFDGWTYRGAFSTPRVVCPNSR